MDGILRSLRASEPPRDIRTIGLMRSLRSDQVLRDAMLRSLSPFNSPAVFLENNLRSKKSLHYLPIGERVLRRDVYGPPNIYEDLTLRYL